ncbi:hypothetical protein Tco_1401546 [Tanacetum coccineum]
MEEEVEYMTDDEVVMSEQEESNHEYAQNTQHLEDEDDVDEWLNAEIKKHMSMQKVKSKKDALISIIKSIRQEMRDGIKKSYDVKEEYTKEIGNPYSRRFDEYNKVFNNEIEYLSNEYILRIGKKGYVLDDVWEKCQQNYKKTNEAWHDEAYEEDEMWRIGDEKTDLRSPLCQR